MRKCTCRSTDRGHCQNADNVTGALVEGCIFRLKYLGGTSGSGGTLINERMTSANGTIVWTGLKAGCEAGQNGIIGNAALPEQQRPRTAHDKPSGAATAGGTRSVQ